MTTRWSSAALVAAALLTATGSSGLGGYSPIIIGDGSLRIESSDFPWAKYGRIQGLRHRRGHPDRARKVGSIEVATAGSAPRQFSYQQGQAWRVIIRYDVTTLTVSTNPNGRQLEIRSETDTEPNAALEDLFDPGATPNVLEHKNRNAKISRVNVQGNDVPLGGSGTVITIHYMDRTLPGGR